jgi:hypothetical protein
MSHLSQAARLEYYLTIGATLPDPAEPTEAARESRLATAVETFNALRPDNAYEAMLAVEIVICGAHALQCLREAAQSPDDFNKTAICRNQAASMMREARAAKRILAQEQKQRLGIEALTAAHLAASVPTQQATLQTASPYPVAPVAPAQATAPEHQAVPPLHLVAATAGAASQPAPAEAAPLPSPEAIAQAEAFALDNLIAAAQLREDGGLTPQNQSLFRGVALPADPAVMEALVRGSSPILDALTGLNQEQLDVAA